MISLAVIHVKILSSQDTSQDTMKFMRFVIEILYQIENQLKNVNGLDKERETDVLVDMGMFETIVKAGDGRIFQTGLCNTIECFLTFHSEQL